MESLGNREIVIGAVTLFNADLVKGVAFVFTSLMNYLLIPGHQKPRKLLTILEVRDNSDPSIFINRGKIRFIQSFIMQCVSLLD